MNFHSIQNEHSIASVLWRLFTALVLSAMVPLALAQQVLSPATISFGNVPLTVPVTQTGTFTNNSTFQLVTITALSTSDARFAAVGSGTSPCNVGAVVTFGASCTYALTFTPSSPGAFNNTTTVAYNVVAAAAPPLTQTSSGTGFTPPSAISPASILFGNVPLTVISNQPFTFTNNSNTTAFPASYTLTSFATSGLGFSAVGSGTTPCAVGLVLPPAASCGATASFQLNGSGASNGTSTISFQTGQGANPVFNTSVALNGVGFAPPFTNTPASLNFGNVMVNVAAPLSYTFTNDSNTTTFPSPYTLTSLSTAGLGYTAVGSGATPCAVNLVLPPGASCGVTATFQIAVTGSSGGSTTIGFLAGLGTNPPYNSVVALSGTGVAPPAPVISSSTTASAITGSAFTYTILATNSPTSFGASGLPTGLTVNAGTGIISGTPTVAGTFAATVTATNAGGTGSQGLTINVTAAPPPSYAYIPNNSSNNVSVIDISTNTAVATVVVGTLPYGVAVNPAGTRTYVTNSGTNNVTVIDTATNTVVATVAVGATPLGVAVNPAGTRAYVANRNSNNVSVIATATNTVIATVAVGTNPASIAVNTAGTRAYVVNDGSNNVSVIDIASNTVVATVAVGTVPRGIAVNPASTLAYVTNRSSNNVSVIDTATNTVVATVLVGTSPEGVAVNPAGTRAYVVNSSNVSVIDTTTNTVVATVAVGTGPAGVAVNPAGTRTYVANFGSNNISVIDTAGNTVVANVSVGTGPLAFGLFIGGPVTATVPGAPTIGPATAGVGSATVSFTPPAFDGGVPVATYMAISTPSGIAASGAASPITVTGLTVGTPYTFTVTATNAVGTGPASAASNSVTPTAPPAITSTAPVSGTVGAAYTHTFTASGTTPITWSIATGTLPPGVTLNAATGILSGTPTAAGSFGFTIQAANGTLPNATLNVTIVISAAVPPGVALSLSSATVTTGNAVGLILNIVNPGPTPLTAGTFTFTYPPGVVTATLPGIVNSCGGTFTSAPGSTAIAASGLALGPTGTCALGVSVSSATAGSYVFTFPAGAFSSSNGSNAVASSVTLTVTAAPTPAVSLAPVALSFGTRTVSTTSPPSTVTLGNSGTALLSIISITASGDYAFTTSCPLAPSTLAVGIACPINVTFTPLAVGARVGNITIVSNAPGSPHTIGLSGTGSGGAVPNISLAPAALAFGAQTVNTASALQSVVVSNTGFANLIISGISVSAPFSRVPLGAVVPPDCAGSVAPGNTCQIGVIFTPASSGTLTGQISIIDNATGSPHTVALSGTGVSVPVAVISVSALLAFGDQVINSTGSVQNLTISNTGTATLNISAITLTSTNAANFTLTGQSGCVNIAPGGNCTLPVTFATTIVGARTAQVNITSNAQNASLVNTVSLTGNGILAPRPVVNITATAIGYGNVIFGGATPNQFVTLTNNGGQVLSIANLVVTGDFIQMSNCGTSLASLASCTISIVFTPLGQGARFGEFILTTSATTSPDRIQLSGTGCRWFSQAQSRFFLTSCGP